MRYSQCIWNTCPHFHCGVSMPLEFFESSSSCDIVTEISHHVLFPIIDYCSHIIYWVIVRIGYTTPGKKARPYSIHPSPDQSIIISRVTDSCSTNKTTTPASVVSMPVFNKAFIISSCATLSIICFVIKPACLAVDSPDNRSFFSVI